jgi:bifunctional DNA-binding transcriptional regulator/antitoxin component of YhaV-PrlF toxin-antitoxin module
MKTVVSDSGETAIPEKIRRDHGIQTRSHLEWIDDGHTIRVVPIPGDPIRAAKGATRGLTHRLLSERARERERG